MDITLTTEQQDIAKEARRFLTKECPFDYVREMYEDKRGFTDDIWTKMAEMDWMAMRIPEAFGGLGMDQIDLNTVGRNGTRSAARTFFLYGDAGCRGNY